MMPSQCPGATPAVAGFFEIRLTKLVSRTSLHSQPKSLLLPEWWRGGPKLLENRKRLQEGANEDGQPSERPLPRPSPTANLAGKLGGQSSARCECIGTM